MLYGGLTLEVAARYKRYELTRWLYQEGRTSRFSLGTTRNPYYYAGPNTSAG